VRKQRFDQLVASLGEVQEHVATGKFRGRISSVDVRPVDVRMLRKRSGMTQQHFAETFGVGLGTLQKWERGERRPSGAARSLLLVMQSNLPVVMDALAAARAKRHRQLRKVRAAA
jgi:putative transcriptional regulator